MPASHGKHWRQSGLIWGQQKVEKVAPHVGGLHPLRALWQRIGDDTRGRIANQLAHVNAAHPGNVNNKPPTLKVNGFLLVAIP